MKTYGIDRQFLWGKGLLVTPVVDPGVEYVVGYFPAGLWYDYYTVRPPSLSPSLPRTTVLLTVTCYLTRCDCDQQRYMPILTSQVGVST